MFRICPSTVFLLALCAPILSSASTFIKKDFSSLIWDADGVIKGVVTDISYDKGPSGRLYTFIKLTDVVVIVGDYGSTEITLRMTGGETTEGAEFITGSPTFNLADQLVLFARGNGENDIPLSGGPQGMYRIKSSDTDASNYITNEAGIPVVGLVNGEIVLAKNTQLQGSANPNATPGTHGYTDPSSTPSQNTGVPAAAGTPMQDTTFIAAIRQYYALLSKGKVRLSISSNRGSRARKLVDIPDISVGTFRIRQ